MKKTKNKKTQQEKDEKNLILSWKDFTELPLGSHVWLYDQELNEWNANVYVGKQNLINNSTQVYIFYDIVKMTQTGYIDHVLSGLIKSKYVAKLDEKTN